MNIGDMRHRVALVAGVLALTTLNVMAQVAGWWSAAWHGHGCGGSSDDDRAQWPE